MIACPPHLQSLHRVFLAEEVAAKFRHDLINVFGVVGTAAFYIRRRLEKEAVYGADPNLARFLNVIQARSAAATEGLRATLLEAPAALEDVALDDVVGALVPAVSAVPGIHVAPPVPGGLQVRGRRDEAELAVYCLLENAADAVLTRSGSTIELRTADAGAGGHAVEVLDDGAWIGTEADDEAPGQASERYVTTLTGRLGLAIARRVAVRCGGSLAVERREAGGTRATLTLPRAAVPVRPSAAPSVAPSGLGPHGGRVLLVDDDDGSRLTLAVLLEEDGCAVIEAGSVAEGRAKLAEGRYALVVLDVHLKDGLGTDLIPMVRRLQPQARVAVLTGSGTPDAGGADALLLKATAPGDLLAELTRLVSPARAQGPLGCGTLGR